MRLDAAHREFMEAELFQLTLAAGLLFAPEAERAAALPAAKPARLWARGPVLRQPPWVGGRSGPLTRGAPIGGCSSEGQGP